LSTFGRRTFQSVDGDPEVASHLPLLQDTYFLLAEERRAAMQRAVFAFCPRQSSNGISDSRIREGFTFQKARWLPVWSMQNSEWHYTYRYRQRGYNPTFDFAERDFFG
jgi:hypothetical protein